MSKGKQRFVDLVKHRYTYWIVVFVCAAFGIIAALFTNSLQDRLPLAIALGSGLLIAVLYHLSLFYANSIIADQKFRKDAQAIIDKMMEQNHH